MKLAVISHTPHYKRNSEIVGWGPTVREINHLAEIFEKIFHIAPLHNERYPASSMSYQSQRIEFVPLKPYGGKKILDKLSIITTAPYNLRTIKETLRKVDWVQFRSPTAMGVYVLPYLSLNNLPRRWVKYAGNWKIKGAPLSYRFQRWWLKKNFLNSFVTINGGPGDEKNNILNFRNPCLDNEELKTANSIAEGKDFSGKLTFCFAGTLTKNKGAGLIIEAARKIKNKDIEQIIFAGDGPERANYEGTKSVTDVKLVFKGFMDREELKEVYGKSHLILLPSESEGFPKVIAEAAAYGCVPIVSDVSSISSYFNDENGFLLKEINSDELANRIDEALSERNLLKEKSKLCADVARQFTFEDYMTNLKEKILSQD